MKRSTVGALVLAALILGIVLGACWIDRREQIRRVPLEIEDWVIHSPSYLSPLTKFWRPWRPFSWDSPRSELFYSVHRERVAALELDLGFWVRGMDDLLSLPEEKFQLLVTLAYWEDSYDWEDRYSEESFTFSAQELMDLAGEVEDQSYPVRLIIPVDPTRELASVFLTVEGDGLYDVGLIEIKRAELLVLR